MVFTIKPVCFLLVPMFFIVKTMLFRWFICVSHSNLCFLVGSYAFQHKTNAFSWVPMLHNNTNAFSLVPMLFTIKHALLLFVPMLFTLKPLLCCCKPFTIKPMLSRWFICFSQCNLCFFVGSYVFHNETNAFPFVLMLYQEKLLLFDGFLCISK